MVGIFPMSAPRRLLSIYVLMQRMNIPFYFPRGGKNQKALKGSNSSSKHNFYFFFFKFQAVSLREDLHQGRAKEARGQLMHQKVTVTSSGRVDMSCRIYAVQMTSKYFSG